MSVINPPAYSESAWHTYWGCMLMDNVALWRDRLTTLQDFCLLKTVDEENNSFLSGVGFCWIIHTFSFYFPLWSMTCIHARVTTLSHKKISLYLYYIIDLYWSFSFLSIHLLYYSFWHLTVYHLVCFSADTLSLICFSIRIRPDSSHKPCHN